MQVVHAYISPIPFPIQHMLSYPDHSIPYPGYHNHCSFLNPSDLSYPIQMSTSINAIHIIRGQVDHPCPSIVWSKSWLLGVTTCPCSSSTSPRLLTLVAHSRISRLSSSSSSFGLSSSTAVVPLPSPSLLPTSLPSTSLSASFSFSFLRWNICTCVSPEGPRESTGETVDVPESGLRWSRE